MGRSRPLVPLEIAQKRTICLFTPLAGLTACEFSRRVRPMFTEPDADFLNRPAMA
ncbi:hypothetical protein [Aurantiacibacter zhengii]|uniref:hypothetical protein n=1 Tax=Aurantiacibacter zhengii TaxID=2307003 RepID=UPI001314660C|nr:hypothetical protein [Aurantiacibacter zhengii]